MRRPPFLAKFPSTVLTVLVALGSSQAVRAGESPTKVPDESAAAQPTQSAATPAKPSVQSAATGAANAEPNQTASQAEPGPDPASITEVGIQRLPGSAYPEPENRGLKYGSLWLNFHGLQWPYMPAAGTGSRFVVGISGWGWVDTSYVKYKPWSTSSTSTLDPLFSTDKFAWQQQARLLLRVTPTYSLGDGYFVQGQAELVGTEDQSIARGDVGGADTDDLFLRVGKWHIWDLQVGRFEGWEVFHLGMAFDENTYERNDPAGPYENGHDPIAPYLLDDNQYRPPMGAAGNFAIHYYPLRILRFELLGTVGNPSNQPMYATRPVAILDLGWLKLKAGTEYQHRHDPTKSDNLSYTTKKGVGGAIQFIFQPHIEFGLNAAQGTVKNVNGTGDWQGANQSFTRTSFGGFANVANGDPRHPLIFGVGGVYTHTEDQHNILSNGVVDKYWLWQSFVAVQYVAFQQLYIKLVAVYSRGHWLTAGNDPPVTFDDDMYSVRLRFAFYY